MALSLDFYFSSLSSPYPLSWLLVDVPLRGEFMTPPTKKIKTPVPETGCQVLILPSPT